MTYTIQHTAVSGDRPFWYHLESCGNYLQACSRARNYALDHGGYVCVKSKDGETVFGTDPVQLDRAILSGVNRDFPKETARRRGCCVS
jgi:hypothetical protein